MIHRPWRQSGRPPYPLVWLKLPTVHEVWRWRGPDPLVHGRIGEGFEQDPDPRSRQWPGNLLTLLSSFVGRTVEVLYTSKTSLVSFCTVTLRLEFHRPRPRSKTTKASPNHSHWREDAHDERRFFMHRVKVAGCVWRNRNRRESTRKNGVIYGRNSRTRKGGRLNEVFVSSGYERLNVTVLSHNHRDGTLDNRWKQVTLCQVKILVGERVGDNDWPRQRSQTNLRDLWSERSNEFPSWRFP